MATSHSFPSRIPVARPSTVPGNTVSSHYKTPRTTTTETLPPNQPLTYSSVPSNEREAVRLRFTCSTPTFNQSTKFSQLARHVQAIPISPMIQRGKDMCARRRFTDHKTGSTKQRGSPPLRSTARRRASSRGCVVLKRVSDRRRRAQRASARRAPAPTPSSSTKSRCSLRCSRPAHAPSTITATMTTPSRWTTGFTRPVAPNHSKYSANPYRNTCWT
ncbi:hypothetical protein B0H10DRAFT_1306097 [Mycena sp. CBHHK59/15]|nr:hypothetical protein B0H10DRAFT_1306097 [Mycena sp. CBHHK59/15]